jgi:putative phosphoesterase
MTRIAVIADIHGNLPALEAVVDDISRRNIKTVLNLGDHVSGPLWPSETASFLMQQPWVHISGNGERLALDGTHRFANERMSVAQKEWLASLPPSAIFQDDILLFHGTPSSDDTYLLEIVEQGVARLARPSEIAQRLGDASAQVMLCGHSHISRIVRIGDLLIVNPGSVGLPAYDYGNPEPHVMETGSPDARYAILEKNEQGWQVEFLAIAYDHHAAADQAQHNARSDWQIALRTGYMGN